MSETIEDLGPQESANTPTMAGRVSLGPKPVGRDGWLFAIAVVVLPVLVAGIPIYLYLHGIYPEVLYIFLPAIILFAPLTWGTLSYLWPSRFMPLSAWGVLRVRWFRAFATSRAEVNFLTRLRSVPSARGVIADEGDRRRSEGKEAYSLDHVDELMVKVFGSGLTPEERQKLIGARLPRRVLEEYVSGGRQGFARFATQAFIALAFRTRNYQVVVVKYVAWTLFGLVVAAVIDLPGADSESFFGYAGLSAILWGVILASVAKGSLPPLRVEGTSSPPIVRH